MGRLIIARHHESEWNKLGKWTGLHDSHLTNYGFKKSEDMGLIIKDIPIDQAFASMEVRSIETLSCILNVCTFNRVPTEHSPALNERDYGDYTGMDKLEVKKTVGEEKFKNLRRAWDYPIPNGETLKMVYERVVPFFQEKIFPLIGAGKNILVVSHGNALRALIKYLENMTEEQIENFEMPFGALIIYKLDEHGHMTAKEIRQTESSVSA